MTEDCVREFRRQLQSACITQELVRIYRGHIDAEDIASEGSVMDVGEGLVLLQRLSDRLDFDGYEVLRIKDITNIDVEFDRKLFFEKALRAKSVVARKPHEIDLTSMQLLLSTVEKNFPLIVIERELKSPDQCEIGRLKLLTDDKYALKWLSIDATWEDDFEVYEIADITRVTFDGEYENTLALVGGISTLQA